MNKPIYVILLAIIFVGCTLNNKSHKTQNAKHFKDSFITQDQNEFIHQFPKNFEQFYTYFGWNHEQNTPNTLYYGANKYIDYWFSLLNTKDYETYENQIITICLDAEWDTDGISYFQHKSYEYIKSKKKYYLINELSDIKARSVLSFLFFTPHPEFDEEFNSHLNPSKQQLLGELFETTFKHEERHEEASTTYDFSDYLDVEHYFVKDIDINKDGISDKIISADPYQGDELLLFVNTNKDYEFALKTINFSEDGGNIVFDIQETETGFVISTAFPDGGFFEAHHYISFMEHKWILMNTVYKTKSSNQEDAFIYHCDVKQGIDLGDSAALAQLKLIPDEADRDKLCVKHNNTF